MLAPESGGSYRERPARLLPHYPCLMEPRGAPPGQGRLPKRATAQAQTTL